jgi:hypothetical protein
MPASSSGEPCQDEHRTGPNSADFPPLFAVNLQRNGQSRNKPLSQGDECDHSQQHNSCGSNHRSSGDSHLPSHHGMTTLEPDTCSDIPFSRKYLSAFLDSGYMEIGRNVLSVSNMPIFSRITCGSGSDDARTRSDSDRNRQSGQVLSKSQYLKSFRSLRSSANVSSIVRFVGPTVSINYPPSANELH